MSLILCSIVLYLACMVLYVCRYIYIPQCNQVSKIYEDKHFILSPIYIYIYIYNFSVHLIFYIYSHFTLNHRLILLSPITGQKFSLRNYFSRSTWCHNPVQISPDAEPELKELLANCSSERKDQLNFKKQHL